MRSLARDKEMPPLENRRKNDHKALSPVRYGQELVFL